MVKHTPQEILFIETRLCYQSRRENRPKIIVEGDFDSRVICKILNTKLIDVLPYRYESSDNKGDLINLVRELDNNDKGKDDLNFVVGVVDADCDGVLEKLYDYKILPYGENIFDTSPSTDMNLLLISNLSLKKYLSDESLSGSDLKKVVNLVNWFGALRTLKKRYEHNQKKRYEQKRDYTVHILLSDLRKKIVQNNIKTPQNIERLVKELEEISPQTFMLKRFFEDIRKTDRLERVLKRFANESIDFHQYINGHDLSMFMKLFGVKGSTSQIEKRLINSAQLNDIKQTKLFKQLWDWGQLHSIDLF